MGYAEYHRAAFTDPHQALAYARGALTAAVAPVTPEITVPNLDERGLARLAARLGPTGPARRVALLRMLDGAPLERCLNGAERVEVQGETAGVWQVTDRPPWPAEPRSLWIEAAGDAALVRAHACGGDIVEGWAELDPGDLEALLDAEVPAVVAWWCAFDGHGTAYHGVRLALHGRYQDGQLRPVTPGQHELVVLVSGKRLDGAAVVARVAAAMGARLTRDGSGL